MIVLALIIGVLALLTGATALREERAARDLIELLEAG